ncbi:GtrA family protein [Geodermatophilus sp. DSM 45219]|uniref:GtrA family protein n=1 Tax=Geodermatophilus sp. DSM 45219 TaxID=1881103 RepID=UPI00087E6916|nr:GtrA family protein [Geodermatophilus sp. DSM 45219]SDN59331.1 Putative flippase GtrA (transmembrane translocase of bactoprenol-linked glucose) [Geodermatophilus sp. DSM 45219]
MLRALCRAQTIRFAVVGLAITALHLLVFRLVLPWTAPEAANVVAFLTATQVNFVLSYFWTWSARRPVGRETVGSVLRRAVLFNGSATLGFGVNAVVFSTALRLVGLDPLTSAAVATVASAATSFLLSSRVVFARRPVLDALEVDAVEVLEARLVTAAPAPRVAAE